MLDHTQFNQSLAVESQISGISNDDEFLSRIDKLMGKQTNILLCAYICVEINPIDSITEIGKLYEI